MQVHRKWIEHPYTDLVHSIDRKTKDVYGEKSHYLATSRDKDQERSVYRQKIAAPNFFLNFHSQKAEHFLQLALYYLNKQSPKNTKI